LPSAFPGAIKINGRTYRLPVFKPGSIAGGRLLGAIWAEAGKNDIKAHLSVSILSHEVSPCFHDIIFLFPCSTMSFIQMITRKQYCIKRDKRYYYSHIITLHFAVQLCE